MSALVITSETIEALRQLAITAAAAPVDMNVLTSAIRTPEGKVKHMEQMTAQSLELLGSRPYFVTFSIETGHPCGTSRHMSMSVDRAGFMPNDYAVWMVAELLGFLGTLRGNCHIWWEDIEDGQKAVNILQPIENPLTWRDRRHGVVPWILA
jgi:hypothetical protein